LSSFAVGPAVGLSISGISLFRAVVLHLSPFLW
jgi:hypothetical protein